ncbi:DUF6893 family small protein [Arthrobacter globiformis]
MKAIGTATVSVLAVMALWGIYVGIRAVPDIRRYMKVRRM